MYIYILENIYEILIESRMIYDLELFHIYVMKLVICRFYEQILGIPYCAVNGTAQTWL
jgi:hypothetical protein